MTKTARRRPRRWLWLLVVPATVSLAGLVLSTCALTQRPAWYRPYTLDESRLAADKSNLANLIDRVSIALNGRQAIRIELDEAQLNRWIAAREEWPEALADLDLGPLEYPQLLLLDGNRLRLAARAVQADTEVIVSVDFSFHVRGDRFVVGWTGTRVGHFPLPRMLINAVADVGDRQVAAELLGTGGLNLPNAWTWPNGRPRFRIRELRIEAERLSIVLEPI